VAGACVGSKQVIERIRTLNDRFGIPEGLEALREEDIPAIAEAALKEAHYTYAVPRYMDQATCEALIARMLVGSRQG